MFAKKSELCSTSALATSPTTLPAEGILEPLFSEWQAASLQLGFELNLILAHTII